MKFSEFLKRAFQKRDKTRDDKRIAEKTSRRRNRQNDLAIQEFKQKKRIGITALKRKKKQKRPWAVSGSKTVSDPGAGRIPA